MKARPTGVTILAVLAALGGLFGLLGSLGLITGAGVIAQATGQDATMLMLTGLVSLILSVLELVFAFGAWTLKPWGWTLGIVAEVISVLFGLYSVVTGNAMNGIVSIIIAAIILWYLFQPNVKQAFGRA